MVTLSHTKLCKCDGTCNCNLPGTTISSDTSCYQYNEVSESEKRAVEEKASRLEKKEELNQIQHWKHKNKPKF